MAAEWTRNRFDIPEQEDFDGDYLPDAELDKMAKHLITSCPELGAARRARIGYYWAREGGKSKGRQQLGKCLLTSGFIRYLSEQDFVIWIAADNCRDFNLSDQQIEALLFHQLMHIHFKVDSQGNTSWILRSHDVELFTADLKRYGAWTSELKSAKEAFDQAVLPLMPAPFGGSF